MNKDSNMRIAINGFGRIGKSFLRSVMLDPQVLKTLQIVAINIGPSNKELVAHSFKYDSIMGTFAGEVKQEKSTLLINDSPIQILTEVDARKLPWKELAIDWVVDCSGKFTHAHDAQQHIQAGAKKVLISAPAIDADIAIIPGVNDKDFDAKKHTIVSLGSCTTNALMPMLKVLYEECGLETALVTTTHAYTSSQALVDGQGKDPRRSRAGALNIVPSSTGASKMVAKIMPQLADKVQATAIRVPVANVSLLEVVFFSSKKLIVSEINGTFTTASKGALKNILEFTQEPCVSSDFKGTSPSVIIDGLLTQVVESMGQVFGWYDNEWAYSQRLKDFLMEVSK